MLKFKTKSKLSASQWHRLVNAQRRFSALEQRQKIPQELDEEECMAYSTEALIEGLTAKVNEKMDPDILNGTPDANAMKEKGAKMKKSTPGENAIRGECQDCVDSTRMTSTRLHEIADEYFGLLNSLPVEYPFRT